MGRFLRRKHVTEEPPEGQSFWQVPPRYNFSRDVVEAYAADPLRPALTVVGHDGVIDRRTFADIAIDAGRWAGLLRSRGLEPGDRLLVVVGLNRAWHGIMLGALKAGLVPVACPASLDLAEIHRRARDCEARVAVVEADRASEVWQAAAPLTIVAVDEAEPELREIPPIQPTHDTASEDEALILYTSGATGTPKGTILTHAATWAARVPAEHWLDARTGDLVWCTVGTSWSQAIWSILFYPWSRGAESVLHDAEFDAEQRFDLLQRLGVTVLAQSPTEYRLLTEAPWISRFDLGRLRHAASSGEPLELETLTAFRKVFDVTIHDGYGQVESALLAANTRGTPIKPGSMGLPLPGHRVAVIDDEGAEVPAGAEGDLALHGRPPTLFAGYVEGAAETAAAFRGDWYLTGDRATRDADGYLWFSGRGAPLGEAAADRARAAEAREAEILALETARADDGTAGGPARLDDAVRRKQGRAAAEAERAAAEAAARAERRADLERRTAEALAADEARREDERRAAEAAERAQREAAEREQERREAEAALAEERARREAEVAAAAERARLDAEEAEAERARADAARRADEERERERRAAEAAVAEAARIEERARREREQAAATEVDGAEGTAETDPSAAPALSGRAARKEQQRIRKEQDRARKDEERRRKEEERARKDAERKQEHEERAAAERRKREEADEQKAAAERDRQAEQRRKGEEKQRRDEEKAARELERREGEARRREAQAAAAAQRAEEARQRAEEEERRKQEERQRKAEDKQRREAERKQKHTAPGETVAEPEDESLDEDRPNAELIARLRAYGLRQPDDGSDE